MQKTSIGSKPVEVFYMIFISKKIYKNSVHSEYCQKNLLTLKNNLEKNRQ